MELRVERADDVSDFWKPCTLKVRFETEPDFERLLEHRILIHLRPDDPLFVWVRAEKSGDGWGYRIMESKDPTVGVEELLSAKQLRQVLKRSYEVRIIS